MDEGAVPYIRCGSDATHYRPFVRPSGDDPEEGLEFWCLECDWIRTIGLKDYDHMKDLLTLYGYFND
jgi:hypothetical protein